MADKTSVSEIIKSAISGLIQSGPPYRRPPTPNVFESKLGRLVDVAKSGNPKSEKQVVLEDYTKAFNNQAVLADPIRQAHKAATRDYAKLLFFRVLTALFMAAIVLGTSWIAQHFGIPLPFRMGAPVLPQS